MVAFLSIHNHRRVIHNTALVLQYSFTNIHAHFYLTRSSATISTCVNFTTSVQYNMSSNTNSTHLNTSLGRRFAHASPSDTLYISVLNIRTSYITACPCNITISILRNKVSSSISTINLHNF